jgi:hypothetical protein
MESYEPIEGKIYNKRYYSIYLINIKERRKIIYEENLGYQQNHRRNLGNLFIND